MSRRFAELPLHTGTAPRWLFDRMVGLAECIVGMAVEEYGTGGLLRRLSDPWFFQSLACVLAFDWHSSGTTTVTCGALKEAIDLEKHGIAVSGGKGRASNKAPQEIEEKAPRLGLATALTDRLVHASKMSAKVDNSVVQAGYPLYHHCFLFDSQGRWIVIQQGLNKEERMARRYHWGLDHHGFIEEPGNTAVCSTKRQIALDMTHGESRENREISLDLVKGNPDELARIYRSIKPGHQRTLDQWTGEPAIEHLNHHEFLHMPRTLNWNLIRQIYEFQPRDYEEFVSLQGVGPSTIRGLALVAELVYGARPSWRDPVRYSFAFGGKDGVPFPVNRKSMDEAIDLLKQGIDKSSQTRNQKLSAFGRLRRCLPRDSELSL